VRLALFLVVAVVATIGTTATPTASATRTGESASPLRDEAACVATTIRWDNCSVDTSNVEVRN